MRSSVPEEALVDVIAHNGRDWTRVFSRKRRSGFVPIFQILTMRLRYMHHLRFLGGSIIVLDRTQKRKYAEFVKSQIIRLRTQFTCVCRGVRWDTLATQVDCRLCLYAERDAVPEHGYGGLECFARVSETLGDESTLTAAACLSTFAPSSKTRFIAVVLQMAGNLHQSHPLSAATISSRSTAVSFCSIAPGFRAGTATPSASRP